MRDSFVFYRSFYEAIRDLPRDVQGEIYTAIMEYGLYGKETEQLKPIARSIFTLMKPLLDLNFARYENAKKGGAPKGLCNNPNGRRGKGKDTNQEQTENKPRTNQEQTENKPYNVNVDVNVDVDVNKEKELSNESPKKKGFDLSFVSPEYHKAFTEWLQYKKDRKETYKTQQSLQKCYTKLINLSGNNPSVAQEIVDQSIANNYAGLFELKKSNKPTATQQAPAGVTLGKGEWITADGRRTYGQGKANIPMNAPPRPADGYSWDMDNGRWIYQ